MGAMSRSLAWRIPIGVLLVAATLFYLQFAFFALANAPLQGVLTLLAAVALSVSAVHVFKGRRTALILLIGTLPLLVFQVVATLVYPDESPTFIVIFGLVPLIAVTTWVFGLRGARQEE